MRRRFIIVLVATLLLKVGFAQKIVPAATPEVAAFNSERLCRIDANLKSWVDTGWMNGALALII